MDIAQKAWWNGPASEGISLSPWHHSSEEKSRMMEKLWGDWFYNPKKKVWTNVQQPEDCEEPLQRGFCQWLGAVESFGGLT